MRVVKQRKWVPSGLHYGSRVRYVCDGAGLDVNVDGTVGIRNEAGAVADAVPVDRILHKVVPRVADSERPECILNYSPMWTHQ